MATTLGPTADRRLEVEAEQWQDLRDTLAMCHELVIRGVTEGAQLQQRRVVAEVPGHGCLGQGLIGATDHAGDQHGEPGSGAATRA
jgi:hypothetical protein